MVERQRMRGGGQLRLPGRSESHLPHNSRAGFRTELARYTMNDRSYSGTCTMNGCCCRDLERQTSPSATSGLEHKAQSRWNAERKGTEECFPVPHSPCFNVPVLGCPKWLFQPRQFQGSREGGPIAGENGGSTTGINSDRGDGSSYRKLAQHQRRGRIHETTTLGKQDEKST